MQYINTKCDRSLKHDILKFLNISCSELNNFFEHIKNDSVNLDTYICNFISDFDILDSLEYIKMFHLSRRLNDADLTKCDNLISLLLEDSPLSRFFKEYSITFKLNTNHIDLYHNGNLKTPDINCKCTGANIFRLMNRLGQSGHSDYCVNGFAFRQDLEENFYFGALNTCPELVSDISAFLEINKMICEYNARSKFYCIEYLIPISNIIFDNNSSLNTNHEKIQLFLEHALFRLYHKYAGINSTGDNVIIRLSDHACINPKWFVHAETLET